MQFKVIQKHVWMDIMSEPKRWHFYTNFDGRTTWQCLSLTNLVNDS